MIDQATTEQRKQAAADGFHLDDVTAIEAGDQLRVFVPSWDQERKGLPPVRSLRVDRVHRYNSPDGDGHVVCHLYVTETFEDGTEVPDVLTYGRGWDFWIKREATMPPSPDDLALMVSYLVGHDVTWQHDPEGRVILYTELVVA